MSNKRISFIGWSYVIVAFIMSANGITGIAYLVLLIVLIAVSSGMDKGRKDDEEKIYPGQDPRE